MILLSYTMLYSKGKERQLAYFSYTKYANMNNLQQTYNTLERCIYPISILDRDPLYSTRRTDRWDQGYDSSSLQAHDSHREIYHPYTAGQAYEVYSTTIFDTPFHCWSHSSIPCTHVLLEFLCIALYMYKSKQSHLQSWQQLQFVYLICYTLYKFQIIKHITVRQY